MRNALAHAGKSGRRVVSAFIATAFAQDTPEAASTQWRNVADQIRPKVPKLASLMDNAEQDVLAYMTFPKQHWAKTSFDKPDRTTQWRDQAPHRSRRHLPQRRGHRPPRRRFSPGTERRMGRPTVPLHDTGNHRNNER